MSEREEAGRVNEQSRLLSTLRLVAQEPYDISKTDLETTLWKVRLLTVASQYLNVYALAKVGGHPGENRGSDLLEQIVAAPFQTFDGEELHPDPFEKAAMLLRGITQGHPFGDGNKRTGLLVASYFLNAVGRPIPDSFDEDETTEFCLRVSAGEIRDVAIIADQLRSWWNADTP
jgi:death on curing protein